MRTAGRFLILLLLPLFFGATSVFADNTVPQKPKYIFLMIGDGMGPSQRNCAERALGTPLAINNLPVQGIATTYSANSKVTDSAAAGTALACGVKTNNGVLGLDAKGNKVESIGVKAKRVGMKVGIISSVELNDATPAAFYAHSSSRGKHNEISSAMAVSGFDLFGGGMLRSAKPETFADLEKNGYKVIREPAVLEQKYEGKVYVCRAFAPAIEEVNTKKFTLAQITAAAIRSLDQNKGFFLMVEGGAIDWRCHSNDAGAAVFETQQFDLAVREVLAFMDKHPGECLLVVTADHETGGMTITSVDKLPGLIKQRGEIGKYAGDAGELAKRYGTADDFIKLTKNFFGWTAMPKTDEDALRQEWEAYLTSADKLKDVPPANEAGKRFDAYCGVAWTSRGHSNTDVVTTAAGVGSFAFSGKYDNTDINRKLVDLLPETAK